MNEKAVTKFLESRLEPEHHQIIPFMLVDGRGLEADGWKTTVTRDELIFQTPTLTFFPETDESITSSSRYAMGFIGITSNDYEIEKMQIWRITALDKKAWWPDSHPNASGTHICMDPDDCLMQPDPFIAARSIASMINGWVGEQYEAQDYGDIRPGER